MSRLPCQLAAILVLLLTASCGQQNPLAVQRQAYELASRGDQESLHRALDLLAGLDPDKPSVEYCELQVICLIRTQQPEQALEVAQAAIQDYPGSFLLNYYTGKIYYEQENHRAALPYLNKACTIKVDDGNAMLLRALAAAETADGSGNAYFLQLTALEEFRQNPLVYNEWAIWCLRTQQPEEAVGILIDAMRNHQQHPVLALNAAVIYDEHLNLPQVAIRYYEMFKETADDSFRDRHIAVQRRLQQLRQM